MYTLPSKRMFKLVIVGMLMITAVLSLASSQVHVRAAAQATYTVYAGMDEPYGVVADAFGPQTIKVHRGDTITWQFLSFHNVHFDSKPADLVVTSQIDGKTVTELNSASIFGTMKNGDVYKAGGSTGVPVAGPPSAPGAPAPTFSVVMDIAPGTYTYVCDIHSGMIGTIIVVDDNTQIPSPTEVEKAGKAELQATLTAGDKAFLDLTKKYPPFAQGDTLQASAGGQATTAALLHFFPETALIMPGQSITWTVPHGLEPHTINVPLPAAGLPKFASMMDAKKQPHFILGEEFVPNVKSGDAVPADGVAKSGLLLPGQSFTLKFPKVGVYSYYCAIHTGMAGLIIVQAPPPQ